MNVRKLIAMLLVVATLMSFAPMAVFAADGTAENKIITVQYLFEDGKIAADPWTASIGEGENLTQTINYPAIVGYEVSSTKSTVGAGAQVTWGDTALTLNVADITADVTVTVVYVPAYVNYTVKFYQQNVDNDKYYLADTVTKTGLTGDKVSITADKYAGFYELPYDKDTIIAADGSTVVEVYYDRNYYLLSFDLGEGGYGVEPQFLRYGAPVEAVGIPVRPGYTFVGWDEEVPATMPPANTKRTAIWKKAESANITVVYWGENANDEQYSYIDSVEVDVATGTVVGGNGLGFCGQVGHTHGESCTYEMTCNTPEHPAHTDDCLTCGKTAHTHTDDCYDCGMSSHAHSTGCYAGVGSASGTGSLAKPDNPAEGQVYKGYVGTYIYIKGTWYDYSGSTASGSVAPTTCGKTEQTHTHTDACCQYDLPNHSHSDDCYKDTIHVHSNSCYNFTCGITEHTHTNACMHNNVTTADGALSDTTLWTYVKADTAEVAPDGSTIINFYFDRTEFTLTFKYNKGSGDLRYTETITAKWGEKIADKFKVITANAGSTFWTESSSGTSGPYTNYFGVMPKQSKTYYNGGTSGDTGTMYYYGEDLTGGGYNVALYETPGVGGFSVTVEDRYEFEGFTYSSGTSTGSSCSGAKFYYTRNSYNLVYMSGDKKLKVESVKYEAPLSGYDETYYSPAPTAENMPAGYEVGAYTFGGWYANPECTVEYDFAANKMPAKAVTVYAKWNPITHNVNVYKDNTLNEQIGTTQTVEHRTTATAPTTPTNGAYTFVGWFYMDNGVEKAFDFDSMPITKDMEIYAKWGSTTLVPYIINYTLEDGTVIADPTTGNILGGNTKTFDAKGGEELYTAYQVGYFPKTSSHSITAVLEGDDANGNRVLDQNEFTFIYVQKDAVPYTVKYLDAETLEPVATQKKVEDNRHAVVTETAANVNDYLPDAFQKRLIVTDGGENVLIFYYTKDETHALVTEQHIMVNGAIETEYSSGQITGEIGKPYAETKYEDGHIPGYVFDHATVTYYDADGNLVEEEAYTSGNKMTLTAGGLHFKFYYRYNRFDVYYQGIDKTETYDLVESFNAVAVSNTHDGYLYAGMYTDKSFTTPLETIGANSGDGMAFKPVAGATYYVKEINERYALPGMYLVWDTREGNNLAMHKLYLMTAIDNEKYLEVGIELDYADDTKDVEHAVTSDNSKLATDGTNTNPADNNYEALHEKFEAKFSEQNYTGVRTDTVTAASGFFGTATDKEKTKAGAADAYLYVYDFTAFVRNPEQVRFSAFFVTPDGIRVEGVKYRDLSKDSTKDNVEDKLTKNNFVRDAIDTNCVCTDKYTADTADVMSYAPLMMRSAYSVNADIPDYYTITKIDGENVETQKVEAGCQTGAVTYTEKEGYIFAGWFTDEACTVAADFSDVQADMTVYAKYVSAKDVRVTLTGVSKYMTASVSAPRTGVPALCMSYTLDGNTTDVTLRKSSGILGALGKLLGSKNSTYTASWNMRTLSNGDTFTVTTYWVTEDGTMVEIETASFIYFRNRISKQ